MEHRLHSCEVFHDNGKNVSKTVREEDSGQSQRRSVKKHSIKDEKKLKSEVFHIQMKARQG